MKVKKSMLMSIFVVGISTCILACANPADETVIQDTAEVEEVSVETMDQPQDTYIDNPDRSAEGYTLIWSDEFDGEALDTFKWSCQIGTGTSEGLTDWGNQEQEYYTDDKENVRVENGELIITAIKEEKRISGKMFTSARIRTMTDEGEVLFSTKYGRVEARIKLPKGEGLWPAFWMLPVDDSIYNEWASSGEIDIMEARGRLPEKIEGTIHYGQNWPNNVYKGGEYEFPEGEDITGYHLYSLEWEPGVLRWYIDNECYHSTEQWFSKGPASAADYTWPAPFDVPFYILLNMAVGGTFDLQSDPYATEYPAEMKVDYVRVYQKEEGYNATSDVAVVADNKDTDAYAQYAASYEDGEFIVDPDFTTMNTEPIEDTNNGIIPENKDWQFAVGNFGGFAKASVEELEEGTFAKIDVTHGGKQTYAVQLIQHMPIIEGYSYKVSFDAKCSTERSFFVSPSGDGDNAWEKYGVFEASVTPELSNYSFVFKMNSITDPTARLEFNLGNGMGTIWIGNVSVTELKSEDGVDHDMNKSPLSDGNRIYNGTFDQGTQRMAFWHIEEMEVTIPDVIVNDNGSEDYSRKAQLSAKGEDAKLYQNGILINGGKDYVISMDLIGEEGDTVSVALLGTDQKTLYAVNTFICENTDESRVEYVFTVPEGIVDNEAVFRISIPKDTAVTIDNVRLCEVKE